MRKSGVGPKIKIKSNITCQLQLLCIRDITHFLEDQYVSMVLVVFLWVQFRCRMVCSQEEEYEILNLVDI